MKNFIKKLFKRTEKTILDEDNKKEKLNFFEKIISSEPKYKSVEDVMHILNDNGFVLKSITTHGICSGHDCIDEFHCEYSSVEAFKENAYKDFEEKKQRIKEFAELSWNTTMFELCNAKLDFRIVLSVPEDNGNQIPCNSYLSFRKENINEMDKKTFEQLLLKLKDYIAE